MTNTTARIKREGKHYEVLVDMDSALKFRKGLITSIAPEIDKVFTNLKKGDVAPREDLQKIFGTEDIYKITAKIVKEGEVEESQEHRSAEQEQKIKQVVDFLTRNAIDPRSGNPFTAERIKTALGEARVNIRNVPVEQQIKGILEELAKIMPIKLETKKVKIIIPAVQVGKAYGVVSQYKESENWKDDGSLEIKVAVPAGLLMDFYDNLNSVTHGSAITEEIKE